MNDPEEVADLLTKTKDVVLRGWTYGCQARTKNGVRTSVFDPQAAGHCVLGAMRLAGLDAPEDVREGAYSALATAIGYHGFDWRSHIAQWNDRIGDQYTLSNKRFPRWKPPPPIVDALDEAIALARNV